MTAFRPVPAPPKDMRRSYLEALPEPQEWFLDDLVRTGSTWAAPGKAYGVFGGDRLVEFHAMRPEETAHWLARLRSARPFDTLLAPSFNRPLMIAASNLGATSRETAFLFRRRRDTRAPLPAGFRLDQATADDLPSAIALGGDFFSSRDEVDRIFRAGGLWIARRRDEPVGCGTALPAAGPHGAVDVGMVVRPDCRRQGIGSAIISTLADSLEANGHRPVAGCAKDNVASVAALQRAGLVADYRLLRIDMT